MMIRASSLNRVSSDFTEGCEELDSSKVKKRKEGEWGMGSGDGENFLLPTPHSPCPLLTASVNRNGRSVDRTGAFGGQKQDHVGDGFRRDPFAEISVGHRRAVLRRVDYRRHYAIGVNAAIFQFRVHAFSQTNDGSLRRAVSRVPSVA